LVNKPLRRILHVEDEPDIREIVRLTLEGLGGFIVESSHSGKEALRVISDFDPDLIMLDVMMPELDGPATMIEIRRLEEFKHTPIVFMTAKAQVHEIDCFLNLGAVDVVIKPFDPSTLSDQINDIWERATARTVSGA
jgi:two-component system, OmpR family, response regulator